MAELATLLIEIAQKRGCEDGANLPDIVRTEPIKLEDRTIQVPWTLRFYILFLKYIFLTVSFL